MKKSKPSLQEERGIYLGEIAKIYTSAAFTRFTFGQGPPPPMPRKPRLPSPEHEKSNLHSAVGCLAYVTDALESCLRFMEHGDWASAAAQLETSIGGVVHVRRELRKLQRGRAQFTKLSKPATTARSQANATAKQSATHENR